MTAAAFFPLCSILHRCGCRALWSGGESLCNIHQAEGPRCPWCAHPALGAAGTLGTVGGQFLAFRAVRRRGYSALAAGVGALLALPPAAVVAGALAWLPTDYPHFLVQDARTRWRVPAGPVRCVADARSTCCPPRSAAAANGVTPGRR